jgi:hypothetical protein
MLKYEPPLRITDQRVDGPRELLPGGWKMAALNITTWPVGLYGPGMLLTADAAQLLV